MQLSLSGLHHWGQVLLTAVLPAPCAPPPSYPPTHPGTHIIEYSRFPYASLIQHRDINVRKALMYSQEKQCAAETLLRAKNNNQKLLMKMLL